MNKVKLLHQITTKIRESLELTKVLDTAVSEVQEFLNSDRVKIYKFDDDGNGQVIAEAIKENRLPTLRGLHFPAGDIPPQARELFLKAKVRSIVNLEKQQIRLSQANRLPSTATDELTVAEVRSEPLNNLLQRPVDPCHVEYLTLMGVKSSLAVPLVNNERLWGLLISHHRRAREISESKLQIVQIVAEQLEMAIAQANLFQTLQQKSQQEVLINEISQLLYSPLENAEILPKVLAKIVPALQGIAGLLCINDNLGVPAYNCYQYGTAPHLSPSDWSKFKNLTVNQAKVIAIDDLTEQESKFQLSNSQQTKLRGLLLMPLHYKQELIGKLAIFRPAFDTTKLWAGNCLNDSRQERPRQSFIEWQEMKQGQVQPWKPEELELIESLGQNLSIAVMQERLYRQEKKQRLLIEVRNQELEKARIEAEKASLLKSEFISTSSHELRTPLALNLNYLKLLKEKFYDNETELTEYIELAHSSAENLQDIVDNVLDIAKIDTGKMEVELEYVDLESLLREQCHLFRPSNISKDIELLLDCQCKYVYADRFKLQQILTNLLGNAFKFTHSGQITIRTVAKTQAKSQGKKPIVEVTVEDTGIGIAIERQATIFEAFVQEDATIRRRYGGTGLGLTICKQLVELMAGTITLSSEGRNRGTKVTIVLAAKKFQ